MSAAVKCLMSVGSALTRVVVSLPVILVLFLILADWYSFTIDYAIFHYSSHSSPPLTFIATIIFNIFIALTLWSYYKTITTSSSVRDNPPPVDYYTKYRVHHPEQPIRVCARCQGQPKPLRAHRQLINNKGAPWVNNCVGFKNYKYFVLFLFYATLSCFLYQIAGISLIISVFSSSHLDASLTSLLCALITGAFAFALTFFTLFHVSLVLSGQTTIEVHAKKTGHDMEGVKVDDGERGGWRENWRAVMGDSWKTWVLPVESCRMTGYEYDFDEGDEVEDLERGGLMGTGGVRVGVRDVDGDIEDSLSESRSLSEESTMGQVLKALSPVQAHDLVPTEADDDNEEDSAV